MAYDAFISYSHSADGKLAPALQRALRYLAKPWYRLRSLNVFRDETDLSAASDLTGAIRAALSSSRYFVYLASPNAANSRWVGEEIEIWKKRNLPENLLIALTEGEIEWDIGRQSFDWEKSNALHPSLKGIFSRIPLWVDLRWAKGDRNLSPRDPRFQHATAMLAAPMHGKTLDELVGEDVHQHRKTQVLIAVVVGALTLLLALSILATLIATKTSQNLQSKLTLIESVLPFFNLEETNSNSTQRRRMAKLEETEKHPFKRLWSSIKANLVWPTEMEKWIEWGPERLAVADDCFSRHKEDVGGGFDCPKLRSEFDEDGLRTDIYGLNAMARTLVGSLNDGRVKEMLMESADSEAGVEMDLQIFLDHAGILLPDKLWKQVKRDTEGDKRGGEFSSRRSFHIWRKPLDGAGEGAELIVIRLNDTAYCGSGVCTNPTLGFLRVGEKYKIIFAAASWVRIAIYDTGRGNMPQIFMIGMSQMGISDQNRTISRYIFDRDCVCYRPYLTGSVKSQERFVDQRVPQDLAGTAIREVPSRGGDSSAASVERLTPVPARQTVAETPPPAAWRVEPDVVIDETTKLMWTRGDFKTITGRFAEDWDDAMRWAAEMNAKAYAGYSDWQVASISEYRTIRKPSWRKVFFSDHEEVYWSRNEPSQYIASFISFDEGFAVSGSKKKGPDKELKFSARLVRRLQ
jgi:hypothetical protein